MRAAPGFLLIAVVSVGCTSFSPPCGTTEAPPTTFLGGCNPDQRTYQTGDFDEPYLYFPGGSALRLKHYLGAVPVEYSTYLAFSEYPLRDGNTSESAGNQAVAEDIDSQFIQIRNDTCAEFWLRLVAHAIGDHGDGKPCNVDVP